MYTLKTKIICILFCAFAVLIAAVDALFPLVYLPTVKKWCKKYNVEPSEVMAVVWTESKFRKNAVSHAGAVGLMQIMPSTAEWLCERIGINYDEAALTQADYNLRLGIYYLSFLHERFEGDLVYAAYNAGHGKAMQWQNSQIDYPETINYIKRIKMAKGIYAFRIC